jgi:hypothetical protein
MRGIRYGFFVVGLSLILAGPVRAVPQKDKEPRSGPVALVNKAIKAAGGEDTLKKFKLASMTAKGTFSERGFEATVTMEVSAQDFDKYRLDATMDFMGKSEKGLVVINGDKAWAKSRNMVRDAPAEDLPGVKSIFHALRLAQLLVPLKDKAYKLTSLKEVKVGDKPAVGIKVTRKGYADVDLYFDKKTHLPVKCTALIVEHHGKKMEVPYEFLFKEPKKISGILHFTKMTVNRDGKKVFDLEISAVRPEKKLDKSLFTKPE